MLHKMHAKKSYQYDTKTHINMLHKKHINKTDKHAIKNAAVLVNASE